jgi:hypothetical protein
MTKVSSARNKHRGSEDERRIASILGTTRYPADTGGLLDLVPVAGYAVQVKGGLRVVTSTIREGLDAARRAAPAGHIGTLAVVDRSGTRIREFVVFDAREFADWVGLCGSQP